jgi:hypothetical protein
LSDISNNTTSHESNSPLLGSGQQQPFSYISGDDICTAVKLEEAEKLYNKLTTKLTNEVIAATAAIKTISLPLPSSNNMQNLTHKNDTFDEID